VVGNGRVIVPYKCVMVFPCITDVWTATSLPTLRALRNYIPSVVYGLKRKVSK
jgi:hypothetical protein